MAESFTLSYPRKIIFGNGSALKLPSCLPGGATVLLVLGGSVKRSGKAGEISSCITGVRVVEFSGVPPEPPLSSVDEIVELGRREDVRAVVAIGGGSVIDAAKAAAMIIPNRGGCRDYFSGSRKVDGKGLFFAALPTTAGTGAEITCNSVLTDPETKIKKSIRSPFMVPDVAIVDPALTLDAPPALTAASGLDAFTQAVESFTSADANPVTRALAAQACRIILGSICRAYSDGRDLQARTEMAKGSLMSAMAFSQSGLGAVHGLAHPIGSLLGIPHGVICAMLLVPVLEWNLPVSADDYGELARECGLAGSGEFISAVKSACERLKIPSDLRSIGLKEEHFPFITRNCRSRSMECNPRNMTDSEIDTFLRKLIA